MSLRWRIAAALATSACAVGTIASTVSYLGTANQLRSAIDETLRTRAAAVVDAAVVEATSERESNRRRSDESTEQLTSELQGDCPAAGAFQPASAAQIVRGDGTVMPCIEGGPAIPVSTPPEDGDDIRTVHVGHDTFRVLSTPWFGGATLQVARDREEVDAVLERLRFELALLVGGATLLAAAMGWAIATRLVRPIVKLRDVTQRIASTNDLSKPIEVRTVGEVGDLAASFAAMVAALRQSQDQQRRLVSDASHEMRTPLTSLRSNLQLLPGIERLPFHERSEVVADVVADVDELNTLLEELVELASDLKNAEVPSRISLGDVARTVGARVLRRHNRIVVVADSDGSEVVARPHQMERAIANLVDNAVKYSPASASVEVSIVGSTVTVSDRGRGITPGDEQRIFERFHRGVDARTEPGSGLGLSIVDEIVRSHGGTVFARQRHGGGSEVGFSLPHDAA